MVTNKKSGFLKVTCKCGNVQPMFGALASEVKCNKCSEVIGQSTGGKAAIDAEKVESF